MPTAPARCAAHPARPAADDCPVCGRPRCGTDAAGAPGGCAVCGGVRPGRARAQPGSTPPPLERLVRAGLATVLLVPLVGAVVSQYVDTATYSLAVPALAGVVMAELVVRAAGGERALRPRLARTLRGVVVAGAVLTVAAGYSFTPGETSLVSPAGRVGPPYALAALGALLWSRPPRRRVSRR